MILPSYIDGLASHRLVPGGDIEANTSIESKLTLTKVVISNQRIIALKQNSTIKTKQYNQNKTAQSKQTSTIKTKQYNQNNTVQSKHNKKWNCKYQLKVFL